MAHKFHLCFILVLIIITYLNALEKGCRMSQLDSKMRPITSFAKEVKWPTNDQQMDEICRTLPGYYTDARNYMKKCTKGESKTIISVSIHSMEKMTVKLFCKNKVERNKMISTAKCTNTGSKDAKKCWTQNINSMNEVKNATNKDKIPLLCCSLLRWKDCFIKVYEDIGTPVCTGDQIEYMDQYLYKSMIDPLNIFCSEYDDSDKCNKFDNFFAKTISKRSKHETPFPAILEIFESL